MANKRKADSARIIREYRAGKTQVRIAADHKPKLNRRTVYEVLKAAGLLDKGGAQ
jgi:hypothetical protein